MSLIYSCWVFHRNPCPTAWRGCRRVMYTSISPAVLLARQGDSTFYGVFFQPAGQEKGGAYCTTHNPCGHTPRCPVELLLLLGIMRRVGERGATTLHAASTPPARHAEQPVVLLFCCFSPSPCFFMMSLLSAKPLDTTLLLLLCSSPELYCSSASTGARLGQGRQRATLLLQQRWLVGSNCHERGKIPTTFFDSNAQGFNADI